MSPQTLALAPSLFFRKICLIVILCSLLLLFLSSYGVFRLYEGFVVDLAESNAESLGQSIVKSHRQALTSVVAKPEVTNSDILQLDQLLRGFLHAYGIVKIKLFSPDGTIVYSTDFSLIGKRGGMNPLLEGALNGSSRSEIQHKDQFRDLDAEARFDVDVVESYVPMFSADQKVVGVFEIYQDMTAYREHINKGVIFFTVGLAIILLIVFICSFLFMRGAARKMVLQQEQLEILARIDPVTELDNRGEITRKLEAEWERYQRHHQKSFALLMLDLDHFKTINDRYGHQVGDELLKRVAHLLRGELRLYSDLGRYGGEEFMILLPDVTLSEAESVADRVRLLIADEVFTISEQQIKITASIGFALAGEDDINLDAVIKRADDNLYAAKAAGRNCISG